MLELAHNIGGKSMNNQVLIEKLKKEVETRNLSPATVRSYLSSMQGFESFYAGRDLAGMGIDEIKSYQHYLLRVKKFGANTVNSRMSGVKFFFRHVLGITGLTELSPQVRTPRKIPTLLSEEDIASLINSLHNVMYKAIIMLTYSAGLRSSDVRNLKPSDIDSKRMVITVRDGKGSRDRQAILSPLALRALRTYWILFRLSSPHKSDYLFMATKVKSSSDINKPLSQTALGYILDIGAKAAGLKKKITPHVLRYSFAIHLLERGTNIKYIQALMGHDCIRSTARYTFVANINRLKVKSPLDSLFEGIVDTDIVNLGIKSGQR